MAGDSPAEQVPEVPAGRAPLRVAPTPGRAVRIVNAVGGARFALVLVAALALLSLLGGLVPQTTDFDASALERWRTENPIVTGLLDPIGGFAIYRSWTFLTVVATLAVNTTVCTVLRFVREGGIAGVRQHGVLSRGGFYALHASIVLLIVAGFFSFATSFSAVLVLTEGQALPEAPRSYVSSAEGPLHAPKVRDYDVALESVTEEFVGNVHRTGVESTLVIRRDGRDVARGTSRFNSPFAYDGLRYVQSEIGYSPRLGVRDARSKRPLLNSFVALKVFVEPDGGRSHRDVLPVPIVPGELIVELLPDHEDLDGVIRHGGAELGTPILRVQELDEDGETIRNAYARDGAWARIGAIEVGFLGLRRWSSLRVTEDPVYPLVWVALWMALFSMILRYWPDLAAWLRETGPGTEGGDDGRTV